MDTFDDFLVAAKVEFEKKWKRQPTPTATLQDFKLFRTIGMGLFGRIMAVQHKNTEEYYAMKILKKQKIVSIKQIDHVIAEKDILEAVNFPFIVSLKFNFKDDVNLYMVLDYVPGGEVYHLLTKLGRLSKEQACFYAAQVVLALEYLHYLDIIYRDLKPENLLIDLTGYVKLCDFGLAKRSDTCVWTFCGTPEYLAPEIILSKGYTSATDWWTLGVFIYEISAGKLPFFEKEPIKMYEKILSGKYKFPSHFKNELKDLLRNLIQVNATKRYGNLRMGVKDIMDHVWFAGINWNDLFQKKIKPPFIPTCDGPEDLSNFANFEEEDIIHKVSNDYVAEFAMF